MPSSAGDSEIAHAARLLRSGRVVVFPTETVYGLGANALDPDAVARIYAVKRRPATSPLIVHVASIEMARSLVSAWPEHADRLAAKFWPGPLTLVLPKIQMGPADRDANLEAMRPQPSIPDSSQPAPIQIPAIVTAGLNTVALRMPAHPVALALLQAADIPLAAPSANRFSELSPTTADHVRNSLGSEVDFILDGGPCRFGIESTVVSLAEGSPVLLRPGAISRADLESAIGPLASQPEVSPGSPHPSPGLHPRHYSPRTPLTLVSDGSVPRAGLGLYLQHQAAPRRPDVTIRLMPQSAADYAAALYDVLHQADAGAYDWIAVDLPPASADWEAVLDRLRRASSA